MRNCGWLRSSQSVSESAPAAGVLCEPTLVSRLYVAQQNTGCHPERTGPQALFSLGVVSRKPALSEVEGDLRLFFKEHLGLHTDRKNKSGEGGAPAIFALHCKKLRSERQSSIYQAFTVSRSSITSCGFPLDSARYSSCGSEIPEGAGGFNPLNTGPKSAAFRPGTTPIWASTTVGLGRLLNHSHKESVGVEDAGQKAKRAFGREAA